MSRLCAPTGWCAAGWLAVLVALPVSGCSCSSSSLAVLKSATAGGVQRDHAVRPEVWAAAQVGDEFHVGDGLKTDATGRAALTLADGNELEVPASTLIRFTTDTGEPAGQRFDVEAGAAILHARGKELRLQTARGSAVLSRGSRMRVSQGARGVVYQVEVGTARFKSEDGEVDVGAGEVYEIGIGNAVLKPLEAVQQEGAGPAGAGGADASMEASPDADSGSAPQGYKRSLDHFSLVIPPSTSATVHSARAPVAVGFEIVGRCRDRAVVQLGRLRYHGSGTVGVPLPFGRHRYRVRCLEGGRIQKKVVSRGWVRVLRDVGTRRLPRRPPTSHVDADGRKYKIYYQNQPPKIVLRWPRAPKAKGYTLVLDGKARPIDSGQYEFSSGDLSDGSHQVRFEAAGRRSRTTHIDVRFDNAATTASLSAPGEGGFRPGEQVAVSGVALPGWKVSADGGTIEMQKGQRFVGTVTTTERRPDVALRLWHPRLGTHYYLRHSAQPP